MRPALASIFLMFLPSVLVGQVPGDSPDSVLLAISDRGRRLAAYDRAAWHATDALMALRPDLREVNVMLPRVQPDGAWIVHFARLSEGRDSLYQIYAVVGSESDTSYTAHKTTPPRLLAEPELRAARALHRALEDFGKPSRPYNSYVLPRHDDGFWVYFIPAQTDARAFPHGGDVRYHVAENGQTIIGRHQMHVSVMNAAAPPNAVSGVHTVVSEDLPQDTDVFLVLRRTPRLPELIMTENHLYEIAVDGSIRRRPKP